MKYTIITLAAWIGLLSWVALAQEAPSRSTILKLDPDAAIEKAYQADVASNRENTRKLQQEVQGAGNSVAALAQRIQVAAAPAVAAARKQAEVAKEAVKKEAPAVIEAKTQYEKAQTQYVSGFLGAFKRVADETLK